MTEKKQFGDYQCHVCFMDKDHATWCYYQMYLDDGSYTEDFENEDGSRRQKEYPTLKELEAYED